MNTYSDPVVCPNGHKFTIRRRIKSAGRVIDTECIICNKSFLVVAGPTPEELPPSRTLLERDIERRLVKRVQELGGEVRKVQWVGRRSAPDRLVMLPQMGNPAFYRNEPTARPSTTIWVELKKLGHAATFPKSAHEKAQHREHERMRKMGQRVEVVDSYERIEEILK